MQSSDCLRLERGSLVLHLSRRKNKPECSRLVRGARAKNQRPRAPCMCWARGWRIAQTARRCSRASQQPAPCACCGRCSQIYHSRTLPSIALTTSGEGTRRICRSQAGGCVAFSFFRRSHGKFVFGGAQLWQILEAGEWRSPAFMKYLDVHRLETDLVMQAHIDDESESEEDVAAS